jgi:hypothetical protein
MKHILVALITLAVFAAGLWIGARIVDATRRDLTPRQAGGWL